MYEGVNLVVVSRTREPGEFILEVRNPRLLFWEVDQTSLMRRCDSVSSCHLVVVRLHRNEWHASIPPEFLEQGLTGGRVLDHHRMRLPFRLLGHHRPLKIWKFGPVSPHIQDVIP